MFSNNSYAKVWDVQEKSTNNGGTIKTIRISTSKKKEDGSYEQDFSGFVRLVGKAKDKAVSNGDRIQLVSVGVTNNYDKEKNITYTNFLCFDLKTQVEIDAERTDGGNANAAPAQTTTSTPAIDNGNGVDEFGSDGFVNIPDGIDEELPFN